MSTALKTKKETKPKTQAVETQYQEPQRISKLGQWMRNNPGGIGIIIDRRAVNR
ncbi:MAG: hypothetical protein LBI82_03570 [Dysgonamonadaceae bacterium]|jgi:hypothetical protein|nr:hypothetical protein [Dysgonamonadaceae bacterium]